MHRLQLHYTLSPDARLARVHNPLMDLLQAVHDQGSISGAARTLGLSYRHVWGELKRWEQTLGNALIVWEKGQAARLTEFGAKLLWAERQAQARLAPQIEALRAELERAFAVAFDPHAHVVTLYASHDEALGALREQALAPAPGLDQVHLDVRFCGSVDALRALNEGRCTMAGFHTLQHPRPGSLAEQTYRPLLQPGQHKLIGFAARNQGLLLAPGNPQGLHTLQDVQRRQARFVIRALGSGTRLVLDDLLAQAQLRPTDLNLVDGSEPTHSAVAHAIASGQADAGLGTQAAAQTLGLDFVPLVQEHYHLVCLKSTLDDPAVQALRRFLQHPVWQQHLGAVPGCNPLHAGEVLSLRAVLPWWTFARRKPS